jgi:hypothetical protein
LSSQGKGTSRNWRERERERKQNLTDQAKGGELKWLTCCFPLVTFFSLSLLLLYPPSLSLSPFSLFLRCLLSLPSLYLSLFFFLLSSLSPSLSLYCLFDSRIMGILGPEMCEIVGVVVLATGRASQQANKSAAENVYLSEGNVCRCGPWTGCLVGDLDLMP